MKKAGIVCCSNGLSFDQKEQLHQLEQQLNQLDIECVWSPYLYRGLDVRAASAKERAAVVMQMNGDETIDMIFDISGGDVANEILDELDFTKITKPFWGYSDLTVILNAIYSQTGQCSILYQIRHILNQERQIIRWQQHTLFSLDYQIVQGKKVIGTVIGGNIRCLLKLAGTRYFPDPKDKILLLEAYSGNTARLVTYFAQLKQMQVFDHIKALLLGTFTEYDRHHDRNDLLVLLQPFIREDLTVIVTNDIGHHQDAKAIVIGKEYVFE